jgi:hypothetical protein
MFRVTRQTQAAESNRGQHSQSIEPSRSTGAAVWQSNKSPPTLNGLKRFNREGLVLRKRGVTTRGIEVAFGSCVTSIAMSTGDAQLYER